MAQPSNLEKAANTAILRQMLIEAFRRLSTEGQLKVIRTAQQLVRKEFQRVSLEQDKNSTC